MRVPELTKEHTAWDRWYAFHTDITRKGMVRPTYYSAHMFTVFDTGEVVATQRDPGPDYRGFYEDLNLLVTMVGDENCPTLMLPDGTTVPKAWLTHGGAYKLIVDLDTRRTIALGHPPADALPGRFVSGTGGTGGRSLVGAYFPGPWRDGIGAPIKLHRPPSILSKDDRERAQEMFDAARMRVELAGVPNEKPEYACSPPDPVRFAKLASLNDLTDHEWSAVKHFPELGKAVLTVDHLMACV